ncbi:diguanylate phosphodiesterase [Solidesulfovibrio fructosivorans JJ]]|uniref:Diguanylate phosphodiesterase n=1 Tax=Solidesulfovibrio fructosivorans JJ] TaxID=596151 RepID=E1K2L2_SOLFR|nr:EAL domain-containing protein [Solidesulfovibrio fructosivorans]EFL49144.1 diguanylate phosphodiesterase [Solidesulfovibrio fructosivorans JJ]]
MSCTLAESNYAVARQPIYRVDGGVYGYELLYRTVGGPNYAVVPSDAEATLAVLANGIEAISQDIAPNKKIFINFSREILEKGYYSFLDPARFVLEVLESVSCDAAFAETLRGINAAGYMLALDDYVGDPAFDAILPVVTFVKIDMLALRDDPDKLEAVVATCQARGKEILAEKVETEADLEFCRGRGISLAQGFYYSRPLLVTTRVLDAGQTARLGLLAELAQPEIDMARVREIIAADVALTYKLLRHVNAACFSRGEPVESLGFAIDLLGSRALLSWVTVNLLASLAATPRDLELAFVSAARGRFLALVDRARGGVCHKGVGMCLLGLLSLLDAMLGMPMDKALSGLPIDASIRDALLGKTSSCRQCLALCRSYDGREPTAETRELFEAFGLSGKAVAGAYYEALAWAAAMFRG